MNAIIQERVDRVVTITLNRPDKLNSLTRDMLSELTETFQQLGNDRDLRTIILTGAGNRAFCAGTDLAELAGTSTTDDAQRVSERGQKLCTVIEQTPLPVIAAINGIAAGGGFELALGCHLRVATPDATFSLPEAKLGIIPGYGGTQRLVREIGKARATEIILTGRTVSVDEAQAFGLINRIAGEGDALAEAKRLAAGISELAPLAIRSCLRAVISGSNLSLGEGLKFETKLFAELFATDDMREGTRAFLEKRKPKFEGR